MENNRFGKNKERSFDRKGGRKNFGSTGFSSREDNRGNRDGRGSDRFGSNRKSFSKDNRSDRDSFSRERKPRRDFSSNEGDFKRDSYSGERRSFSGDRRDDSGFNRRIDERNTFSNERRSGKKPFSNDRRNDRYSSDRNDRFSSDRNDRDNRGGYRGKRDNREERSFDKKDRYSDRGRRDDRNDRFSSDRNDRGGYRGKRDNREERSFDKKDRYSDRGRGKSDWSEKRERFSVKRRDEETEKTFKADRDTLQKRHYSKKKQMEHKLKNPHMEESFRLNRYIANAGVCSRREADKLIEEGRITVNGKVVTEVGTKVKFTDTVRCDGKSLNPEKKIYILLNKPKDFVTTVTDPMNRRTVMDLIKDACKERVYPVGRLDRMTSGLLLFTNDGDLAKKLTHPKYDKKKIYHAFLDKDMTKTDMAQIAEGVELEDGFIQVDEISYVDNIKNQVGVEIHSGKNRIVRRIFEHMGYEVEKLDRVYFAGLTKKNLPRGKWRMLTEKEVTMLKLY